MEHGKRPSQDGKDEMPFDIPSQRIERFQENGIPTVATNPSASNRFQEVLSHIDFSSELFGGDRKKVKLSPPKTMWEAQEDQWWFRPMENLRCAYGEIDQLIQLINLIKGQQVGLANLPDSRQDVQDETHSLLLRHSLRKQFFEKMGTVLQESSAQLENYAQMASEYSKQLLMLRKAWKLRAKLRPVGMKDGSRRMQTRVELGIPGSKGMRPCEAIVKSEFSNDGLAAIPPHACRRLNEVRVYTTTPTKSDELVNITMTGAFDDQEDHVEESDRMSVSAVSESTFSEMKSEMIEGLGGADWIKSHSPHVVLSKCTTSLWSDKVFSQISKEASDQAQDLRSSTVYVSSIGQRHLRAEIFGHPDGASIVVQKKPVAIDVENGSGLVSAMGMGTSNVLFAEGRFTTPDNNDPVDIPLSCLCHSLFLDKSHGIEKIRLIKSTSVMLHDDSVFIKTVQTALHRDVCRSVMLEIDSIAQSFSGLSAHWNYHLREKRSENAMFSTVTLSWFGRKSFKLTIHIKSGVISIFGSTTYGLSSEITVRDSKELRVLVLLSLCHEILKMVVERIQFKGISCRPPKPHEFDLVTPTCNVVCTTSLEMAGNTHQIFVCVEREEENICMTTNNANPDSVTLWSDLKEGDKLTHFFIKSGLSFLC